MPILVWDRQYLREQIKPEPSDILLATPFEYFDLSHKDEIFDGPVTPRVAVLDFDDATGKLRPGATFIPCGIGKTVSCFDVKVPDTDDEQALMKACESDSFIQVNLFATVMKTISFFESGDALGREVTWAFKPQQLLVVPRAGLLANAFYDRESGSLQFFYCPSSAGHTIYTALSPDIIVHETMHAILDGIAPDLYHATRTQSIALHEAIADLAAIVLTILSEMVLFSLYNISTGQLDIIEVLSKIAEEFGGELRRDVGVDFLRTLRTNRSLDPDSVDLADPYEVSEVLSGACYQVLVNLVKTKAVNESTWSEDTLIAGRVFARLIFRALDYLPPGEASLADFARAVIAAHRAFHGGRRMKEQQWLAKELVARKVVKRESDLEADCDVVGMQLKGINCHELLASDAVAEKFAADYRELLRIPTNSDFKVQQRRVRIRVKRRRRNEEASKDLIFRVTWVNEEEHDLGSRFSSRWVHTVGTTLVLDWKSRRILSVLSTDEGESQHADRNRTLKNWVKRGLLLTAKEAAGFGGQARSDAIIAKKTGRAMRVSGSARVLCS
jgi:hypothetical protein